MKSRVQLERYVLISSLIVLYILTIFVAYTVYRYSEIVTRGAMGVALIYLLFVYGKYSLIDISFDALLRAPNKGKYFISAFVGGLLFSWAVLQIMEMVFFFIK